MEFFSNMSWFEIGMLICFGASWPFAVVKTYKSKNVKGKSIFFLSLIFLGYIFGILNKVINHPDPVVYLYVLNGLFVLTDIGFWFSYRNRPE
jgi:hypothetical protein